MKRSSSSAVILLLLVFEEEATLESLTAFAETADVVGASDLPSGRGSAAAKYEFSMKLVFLINSNYNNTNEKRVVYILNINKR